MELTKEESDALSLRANIVDVARLDEEVKGLLAQFETASDEELVKLKQEIKALESLRKAYRKELETYRT
jgi:hypothetical protein